MAFFGGFIDKAISTYVKEVGKSLTNKDDIGLNLITGGTYGVYKGTAAASKKTAADYQYRNGGKTALKEEENAAAAEELAASNQAKSDLNKKSDLASTPYAAAGFGGGGTNLQSFTNRQTKRSILGSF